MFDIKQKILDLSKKKKQKILELSKNTFQPYFQKLL